MAGGDDAAQAGAHHEQEQQRLKERRHDAGPVLEEADHLAPPHDGDGTELVGEAACDEVDLGDGPWPQRRLCLVSGAHRMPAFGRSASEMVVPVYVMNTSSRLGRVTVTVVIGTVSSANSRGTNSAPPAA